MKTAMLLVSRHLPTLRALNLWILARFFPSILIDAVLGPPPWMRVECAWTEGPYIIGVDQDPWGTACAVLCRVHKDGTMEVMAQKRWSLFAKGVI